LKIKLFTEKKNKRIEELDDEGWISDLAFFVDVTGHWNTLNKELQSKDKFITEMFDIRLSNLSFDCGKIN
jgi:hypothetical protein